MYSMSQKHVIKWFSSRKKKCDQIKKLGWHQITFLFQNRFPV